MPITPTNITKNAETFINTIKRAFGGYGFARYGLSLYGDSGGMYNASKYTPSGGYLLLEDGDFMLLEDGDLILLSSAGITNQIKN